MSDPRTINVDALARVEGEGGLTVKIDDGYVQDIQLRIYEPPRFFEAFMRQRKFNEAPDITARICGICPVAYQMSSIHAIEDAIGLTVDEPLRALRRLLYCGEWIESHVLHIFMLHAPDFLGYEDSIRLAADNRELVEMGLKLKKAGNEIVNLLGGREIHPINVRVGGFYRIPTKREWAPVIEKLKWARDAAQKTVRFAADLPFPDFERDYEFVSLRHPNEYPMNEGRLVSNKGLDIAVSEYENHFAEEHVEYSTALHSVLRGKDAYFVGPMARYSLNFDKLSPIAQEAAREANLGEICLNPYQSIIVRSIETLYAVDEALRILENYDVPTQPFVTAEPKGGTGHGCTEAPRGILYHRYELDDGGMITDVNIVPPTSQNQKTIEQDLWHYIPSRLDLTQEELTWQCEQAIRNYDPCISCAAHFLTVTVEEV